MRRPEIKSIYNYCKENKGAIDMVLFLRWDRYARNVEFAFTYKRMFMDELGVEINAVEEPIDFSAADWPLWLALRCSIAHTEDIKISLRTQDGIHEHLMQGKWCGIAPRGYKNIKGDEDAGIEPSIAIDQKVAPIIKQVFARVAEGVESPSLIKRELLPGISKSLFYKMLRNRFYIGYINVKQYRDYPACEVRGRHEPLIDEATFQAVQDVMDGKRKRKPKMNKANNPNLFLRKYLRCPVCGYRVTGATSTGNGGYYDYYTCSHDHKHLNIRAEKANELFVKYVDGLVPCRAFSELYREILSEARGELKLVNKDKVKKLREEMEKAKERINKVNDLYFDGDLSKADRDEQIYRYKGIITDLETRIKALQVSEELNIKDKLNYSCSIVENLGKFFSTASAETKVRLLGSIFNEEIEFDGKNYRTSNFKSVLGYIYQNANELHGQTETDSPDFSGKSAWVAPSGIEPLFKV